MMTNYFIRIKKYYKKLMEMRNKEKQLDRLLRYSQTLI